jgi:hypothetical protein
MDGDRIAINGVKVVLALLTLTSNATLVLVTVRAKCDFDDN